MSGTGPGGGASDDVTLRAARELLAELESLSREAMEAIEGAEDIGELREVNSRLRDLNERMEGLTESLTGIGTGGRPMTAAMTPWELFVRSRDHLLTQGRKAEERTGATCLYRTPEGPTCAVGCLIPDGAYDPGMEGRGVRSIQVSPDGRWWVPTSTSSNSEMDEGGVRLARALTRAGIPATKETRRVLCELQRIHDTFEVEDWPRRLEVLGRGIARTAEASATEGGTP